AVQCAIALPELPLLSPRTALPLSGAMGYSSIVNAFLCFLSLSGVWMGRALSSALPTRAPARDTCSSAPAHIDRDEPKAGRAISETREVPEFRWEKTFRIPEILTPPFPVILAGHPGL